MGAPWCSLCRDAFLRAPHRRFLLDHAFRVQQQERAERLSTLGRQSQALRDRDDSVMELLFIR